MHSVIRAIVYAKNKDDAFDKAKKIFTRLCEKQNIFDYFATFDDKSGSPVSGKGRWGNLPVVVSVDSKEGKKLIDDGWKFTKDEFKNHFKQIKEAINTYSEEELFYERILDIKKKVVNKLQDNPKDNFNLIQFRYNCYSLGEYRGGNIFLYDDDGDGIRTLDWLKIVLEAKHKNKKDKIWVVPADVHY